VQKCAVCSNLKVHVFPIDHSGNICVALLAAHKPESRQRQQVQSMLLFQRVHGGTCVESLHKKSMLMVHTASTSRATCDYRHKS
jgi:hypothetical protein